MHPETTRSTPASAAIDARRTPAQQQARAANRIFHHLALDARCGDFECANLWSVANPLEGNEAGYINAIYADPHTQLVSECVQEIKRSSQHRARQSMGIASQSDLLRVQLHDERAKQLWREVAIHADALKNELARAVCGNSHAADAFEMRLQFIQKLRTERGDQPVDETTLIDWRLNYYYVTAMPCDVEIRGVEGVLAEAGLLQAYCFERDNRQDLHAATNLLKLAVLKKGGTFIPRHVLPAFEPGFLSTVYRALEAEALIDRSFAQAQRQDVDKNITSATLHVLLGNHEFDPDAPATPQWDRFCSVVEAVIGACDINGAAIFTPQGALPDASNKLIGAKPDPGSAHVYDMEAIVASGGEGGLIDARIADCQNFYGYLLSTHRLWATSAARSESGAVQHSRRWDVDEWSTAIKTAHPAISAEDLALLLTRHDSYFMVTGNGLGQTVSWISGVGSLADDRFSSCRYAENANRLTQNWADMQEARRRLESTDQTDLPDLQWETPRLLATSTGHLARPSQYTQQTIVQFDGDGAPLLAAEALYNKHPEISYYFQASPVNPGYRLPDGKTEDQHPPLYLDGPKRLLLVGHGGEAPQGLVLANYTVPQIKSWITNWLDAGVGVNVADGLTVSLVGCNLATTFDGHDKTFAQALADDLAPDLAARDIAAGSVTLTARPAAMGVKLNGHKTSSHAKSVIRVGEGRHKRKQVDTLDEASTGEDQIAPHAKRQAAATLMSQAIGAFGDPQQGVDAGTGARPHLPDTAQLALTR